MCVGGSLWILNSEHLTCRRDAMCPCCPPGLPQAPENTCVSRFLWVACFPSTSWICPLSRGLNSLCYCLHIVGDSGLGAGDGSLGRPSHPPGTPALSCFLGVRPKRSHREGGYGWGSGTILLALTDSSGGNRFSNEANVWRHSAVTVIQGRLPDPPLRPWLGEGQRAGRSLYLL